MSQDDSKSSTSSSTLAEPPANESKKHDEHGKSESVERAAGERGSAAESPKITNVHRKALAMAPLVLKKRRSPKADDRVHGASAMNEPDRRDEHKPAELQGDRNELAADKRPAGNVGVRNFATHAQAARTQWEKGNTGEHGEPRPQGEAGALGIPALKLPFLRLVDRLRDWLNSPTERALRECAHRLERPKIDLRKAIRKLDLAARQTTATIAARGRMRREGGGRKKVLTQQQIDKGMEFVRQELNKNRKLKNEPGELVRRLRAHLNKTQDDVGDDTLKRRIIYPVIVSLPH